MSMGANINDPVYTISHPVGPLGGLGGAPVTLPITLGHEPVNELLAALAAAQAEMSNATMDGKNPHFNSRYATLAAIRDATIPHLAKHGLSIHQVMKMNGHGMVLVTRLGHSSGQWLVSEYPIPNSDKPHVMGSAITYARRYSWAAITGIAAEEDEDGNAAQESAKNGTAKAMPARKSSAAAKRDGDWPKFEEALRNCQSAREVEKLHAEYQRDVYPTWNYDWQATAEQEFGKCLAEFSSGPALKDTLRDSLVEDDEAAHLRDEMIENIQKMATEAALLAWKEGFPFRSDLASLPKAMQVAVRRAGAMKLETLQKAAR